ncbi:unnamed protein product [Strongylus vulgaris]|uniref:Uncharacterized protein n=1 Tax=Strongylus vulgaris TaxID=40348 RepID=A0A3P7KXP8_STRVU|nr:unnamed protein product [Strongylus vulgaris]
MWLKFVVLLLVIYSVYGSIMIQQAEVGKKVELRLGSDVVTWKRVRKDDIEEFIKYCGPTEKGPRCSQFVTADNKPAVPETNAHVNRDGTLVIESFKETDAGLYSSPDQKPNIEKQPDGSETATLAGHIELIVKE